MQQALLDLVVKIVLKEVSIEIIRKCPNYCIYCSSLSDDGCAEVFEFDRFTSTVKHAAELGANTICLSGGEPFLHSRIVDMIELVASLGLQTYVYTSGIIFDEHNQRVPLDKDMLRAISKNVSKLIFNIEAAKPSTYDAIMGTTDCFKKLQQSVLVAHSLAITTEAHFVPMKLNIGEVEAVIHLCQELRISKLSFLRLVLHGRAQNNEALIAMTDKELESFKRIISRLRKQSELDIRLGVPLSSNDSCHKCEAANGKLNIKYDGNVFPCEVFKNDRISHYLRGKRPENVNQKLLKDIYHNSPYLNAVRDLSKSFLRDDNSETCVGQYLISSEGIGIHD